MTINQEVAGPIPDTYTILKVNYVCNGVRPASFGQLGSYLFDN